MTWLQAVVLALIQGVTEFLPISSSAHLILVPVVLGWPDQGLHYDVAVNTGTLLAVMAYFRQDLLVLGRAWLASLGMRPGDWPLEGRLAWFLGLATIPVAVCGVAFYEEISTVLRNPRVLATTSILFGVLLLWADRAGRRRRPLEDLGWWDAALVGVAEAMALVPGTSRSGVTMTAALFAGFDRVAAARFSFLLAVPVGILAAAKDTLELVQAPPSAGELGAMALGFAVAAISAYLVIDWLLAWVRRQDLTIFVVYKILLGVIIFLVVV